MLNSPVDCKGLIISSFLNKMQEQGWIELGRWPAYFTDDRIIHEIQYDPKFEFYIAENEGAFLETHAGSKSYFFNTHRKLRLNPFYSTDKPRGLNIRRK